VRLLPRLHAGSDAYHTLAPITLLIAKVFYFRMPHLLTRLQAAAGAEAA
jgi:hypothetical protein